MAHKITPTFGGWHKSFRRPEHQREFERAASRELLAFRASTSMWRDRAIRRLLEPLIRRRLPTSTLADFSTFVTELVDIELSTAIPELSQSTGGTAEAVAHRQHLRYLLTYKDHAEELFQDWLDGMAHLVGLIADRVPEHASIGAANATFTVPLIEVIDRQSELVQEIVSSVLRFVGNEHFPIRPGCVLGGRARNALLKISKLSAEAAGKSPHRLIAPADAGLTGTELLTAYLSDMPFFAMLVAPVPYVLPEEQRFAGHWMVAPPGRGKTNALHCLLLGDLGRRDACVIVMDSKGDLIGPLKEMAALKDRLVLIEPDPEFPLALNPLDIPKTSVAHAVSLLEYVFSALLEAKMTALQQTLFRKVLPAIVEAIPNATLETFADVIANGFNEYKPYIAALPDEQRAFLFDTQSGFLSKTYTETRNQLIWRLQFLLSNPIIRQMFSAMKTKLDIGKEMDAGKVILIDNSKKQLGDEGAEFLGRFFIALVLAAAEQRSGRSQSEKKPTFVYIDECQNVIRRDEKISIILDECRSQKVAMILAHQRTAQIVNDNVLDALANCAIRMANSDDEAKYLADKLRSDTETLRSLPRGTFAAFVRDHTKSAIALKVPYVDLSRLPRLSPSELRQVRERMRLRYSFVPTAAMPRPSPTRPGPEKEPPPPTGSKTRRPPREGPSDPETGTTW